MSEHDDAWRWACAQYLQSLRSAGLSTLPRAELGESELEAWLAAGQASPAAPANAGGGAAALAGSAVASATRDRGADTTAPPLKTAPHSATAREMPSPQSAPRPFDHADSQGSYPPSQDADGRVAALKVLESQVSGCTRCAGLVSRRKCTVFGEGPPTPRIVFFGEAPGEEEDKQGRPFVGAAGQLLDKMIVACGFQRSDVYILNSLKCRPPGNRAPADAELDNCREYWQRQLDLLQPEYIVCLGAYAIRCVIGPGHSVGRLRGRFHHYRSSKVVATYHPSYLLRTPQAKRLAWDDLKLMLADMGQR